MILVVGAILLDSLTAPTRLLAARRRLGTHLGGGWEFPGGKVEPEEQPLDALRRELAEELAVEVEIGQEFADPAGGPWPIDERYAMRTWFAEIVGGAPLPTDSHDGLRWLDADELFDVAWLPADRPIVALLRAWLLSRRLETE